MNDYEIYIPKDYKYKYIFLYNKITKICCYIYNDNVFYGWMTRRAASNNLYDMSEKEMIIGYILRKLTPLEMVIYNIRVIDDKNV